MSKRQHAKITMDNHVDLDHPENLMDNWFISSKETKKQRDSQEPRDRRAWEARRALHPIPKGKVQGWWQYSRKSRQRKWTVRRNDQHKLSRKTSGLTLDESMRSFPIEFGDFEISWIYRDYWVCGDTL
ncbi:hypothetical protein IFR05_017603, partial [Cadophora sp. M221]